MFHLECFVNFLKQAPKCKGIILVDNDRKMSDFIKRNLKDESFKNDRDGHSIILLNYEKSLSLLDLYENTKGGR